MTYIKKRKKQQIPLLFLIAVLHITVFESCFLSEMEGSWVKEVSLWCVKNTNKVCCSQLTLRPKRLALTCPPHILTFNWLWSWCSSSLFVLFSSFVSSSVLRKLLLKLKLSKLHTSKTSKLKKEKKSFCLDKLAFLVKMFTIWWISSVNFKSTSASCLLPHFKFKFWLLHNLVS